MNILKSFIALMAFPILLNGQIPYGNNPETGKYIQTKDAKIYYEIYGEGPPLLLLHGSMYGYIDEFTHILPELTKRFRVIAVALRGHGKSEIGNRDYGYGLFADDAIMVLEKENIDRTSILGFSSGAITAVRIASEHPEKVSKVVSIAGVLAATKPRPKKKPSGQEFVEKAKEFVKNRKTLMPEPDRFIEFYDKLQSAYLDSVWVNEKNASKIKAPILVIGGDRDQHFDINGFVKMYKLIPHSSILILPNSGHVDVLFNKEMYLNYAIPFLEKTARKE